MDISWLAEPQTWVGLVTLLILEVVLGIDNLVFVAILANKVKPVLRDRARITGLSLAVPFASALRSGASHVRTLIVCGLSSTVNRSSLRNLRRSTVYTCMRQYLYFLPFGTRNNRT